MASDSLSGYSALHSGQRTIVSAAASLGTVTCFWQRGQLDVKDMDETSQCLPTKKKHRADVPVFADKENVFSV
jgi:hypothetical protein